MSLGKRSELAEGVKVKILLVKISFIFCLKINFFIVQFLLRRSQPHILAVVAPTGFIDDISHSDRVVSVVLKRSCKSLLLLIQLNSL